MFLRVCEVGRQRPVWTTLCRPPYAVPGHNVSTTGSTLASHRRLAPVWPWLFRLFPHAPSCRPHQTTRASASSPSVCPNYCSTLHRSPQSSSKPHLPDPIHPPPPLSHVQTSPYSCSRQWFLSSALPHVLFSKCLETSRVRT